MRVLCATTANDGHFGPIRPFALACARAGHDVLVAAPQSFAAAVSATGLRHAPFADGPPELLGPVMASLPSLSYEEADDVVVREVFAGIDAQAGLPALTDTIEQWRPDLVLRESAELASLAAAEQAGVPHVQVAIGMQEVSTRLARTIEEPLTVLDELVGLETGHLSESLSTEPLLTLVPRMLDEASGPDIGNSAAVARFREPKPVTQERSLPSWGDANAPLVYVTFGSVAGSIPHFAGVFRQALQALEHLPARVLLTVGRSVDPAGLAPWPSNVHVEQWLPQDAVLAGAAAMLSHGGFGTTLGAAVAAVPQAIVPLFSFDQVINGEHVAAVGAGLTVGRGPEGVGAAAGALTRLLAETTFRTAADRMAHAIQALPPVQSAPDVLVALVNG